MKISQKTGRQDAIFLPAPRKLMPYTPGIGVYAPENGTDFPVHKLFTQIVLQNPSRFFIMKDKSKCVPDY